MIANSLNVECSNTVSDYKTSGVLQRDLRCQTVLRPALVTYKLHCTVYTTIKLQSINAYLLHPYVPVAKDFLSDKIFGPVKYK